VQTDNTVIAHGRHGTDGGSSGQNFSVRILYFAKRVPVTPQALKIVRSPSENAKKWCQ
jgi:hypothetical protein